MAPTLLISGPAPKLRAWRGPRLVEITAMGWRRDALEVLDRVPGLKAMHAEALLDAEEARSLHLDTGGPDWAGWEASYARAGRYRREIAAAHLTARRLLFAAVLHETVGEDLTTTLDIAGLHNPFGRRQGPLPADRLAPLSSLLANLPEPFKRSPIHRR